MNKPIKTWLFAFGVSSLMFLATIAKANSSNLYSNNVNLIDGINNSLKVVNSNTSLTSGSNSDNNEQFSWVKTLSLDQNGNFSWSNEITYNGTNNVYIVDGINNKLQALAVNDNSLGNIYLVDGINNSLQVLPNNSALVDVSENLNNESEYDWNWSFNSQSDQGLDFFANLFGNQQFPANGQFNFPNNFDSNNSSIGINFFANFFGNLQFSTNGSDPNSEPIPEPNTILGALLFGVGTRYFRKIVNKKQQADNRE